MKTTLIPNAIADLLHDAVKQELTAYMNYQDVANNLQFAGFFGAQKYFLNESEQELTHYRRLVDYLNDVGVLLSLPTAFTILPAISDIGEALALAYKLEKDLLDFYNSLYTRCLDIDVTTSQFLLQYVEIQRKSVGEVTDLIARYAIIENDSAGVLLFDKEMGDF